MPVVPRMVRRSTKLIDLAIRNRPSVIAYRLSASKSLNAAFAGATPFLTVKSGDVFSSPTVRRNKLFQTEGSNLGLTRVWLDIDDYADANIPGDSDVLFLRVAEVTSGGALGDGPILVIPPPDFFETGRRNLVLVGNAPQLPSRGNNLPPSDGMRVFFPKFADELQVYNENNAGGNSLYFSLGLGLNELKVTAADWRGFSEAGANEIILRGDSGSVPFSLTAAIVNGIQA